MKKKIDKETYLEAVKRLYSTHDLTLSRFLECTRKTVYNFRQNNPEVIKEAEEYLDKLSNGSSIKNVNEWDSFSKINLIREWEDILIKRFVTSPKRKKYMRSFWHCCRHLRIHPAKITVEDCAALNMQMRDLYYRGESQPYGLAYESIREGIRSFFMLVRKLSGEYLTNMGISKESGKGSGRYSKQKVPKEIRHRFEKTLMKYCDNQVEYDELLQIAKFMYETATRISSSLAFSFKTNNYRLDKDMWILEVIDKGRKGGKKWEKILIADGLESMKAYLSKKYDLPIDELEEKIPHVADKLFPIFGNGLKNHVALRFKKALRDAGLIYKSFPPTHIWRHSFAQDMLQATGYNYEHTATVGGWVNTGILKKHYGEMSLEAKIKNLKRAKGIPVEEEIYEFGW